ncbi:MAG TPA: hypothetical protein VIA18_08270, partial [Polyangia bacterium]|nr:hypothetical protein [Polyangia bacterium]
GSPTISHNVCVVPTTPSYAVGIGAAYGNASITDNRVQSPQGGIETRLSGGLVARNFVQLVNQPYSQWTTFGVLSYDPTGLIVDANVVDTGNAMGYLGGNAGIGFATTGGAATATVTSNTVRFGVGGGWPNPAFGIGDFLNSSSGTVTYSMMNNIVWGVPDAGGSQSYGVLLVSGSTFAATANLGLDNNDVFGCADGLVNYGASNGSGGTIAATAVDMNGLANASANLSFALPGTGSFVDDNSNWRLEPGASVFGDFATVKHGGLVLSDAGGLDADGKPRPAGFTGSTGWSMGAYQQSY